MEDATLKAVKKGRLSEKRIDETVERILSLVEKSGKTEKEEVDWNEHHRVALKIAEKGAVLLKNEDKILPLKEDEDIALFGFMAGKMRYQGTGSSHINPKNLIEPIEFFKDKPWIAGVDENGNFDECAIKEITEGAKKHRVIIAFVGLPESYESEAFDRDTMKMPSGYLKLLEVLTEANPNTVAVLFSGSVVDMSWENSVKAILYMGLPGEAGGEALYNLIYGKAVPGGKLAETWPLKYSDVPSSDSWGKVNAEYREGIYVGYRYYDKAKMKVRYPFGYGLSYTEFEYSNLIVEGRKVSLTVKNVGEYDGDEVVELYIKNPEKNGYRSLRELRGFSRVRLNRGEEKRVSFTLTDRDFPIYDGGWRAIGGDYTIEIGSSSRDIRLSALIHIEGDEPRRELDGSWYCDPVGKPSKEEFERLIGRSVEEYKPRHKGEYTMDNSCMEMKEHSLIMKIQYRVTENIISKSYGGKKDYSDPGFKMMMVASADCPLRTSIINSGGTLTERMARSFLLMANGKCIKGILSFISPFLGAK